MFLSNNEFDVSRFSDSLKRMLNFDAVISKAIETKNNLIQPSHFLLALLDLEDGMARRIFLKRKYDPWIVIETVMEEVEVEDGEICLDMSLKREFFSPECIQFLDNLDAASRELACDSIEEPLLLSVLLVNLEPEVAEIFEDEVDLEEISRQLRDACATDVPDVFDDTTGVLNSELFDHSGKMFLQLLCKVFKETGHSRIGILHAAIAIASMDDGLFQRCLRVHLADPIRLVRELKDRVGTGQSQQEGFSDVNDVNKDLCYMSVVKTFETASRIARTDGRLEIGESQVLRALIDVDGNEGLFVNTLSQLKVNIKSLVRFAESRPVTEPPAPDADQENPWERLQGKWTEIEPFLRSRIIGQNRAIEVLLQKLKIAIFGARDPNRPVGKLFFAGPTGVGKTEIARVLADFIFQSQDALLRFDMTEYVEKHSVSKLIGAPPGYVGHEEGGKLTKSVLERPFSILLFDEIEKAHPDIYKLFIQIFDYGRLTDMKNQVATFNNTIIIMTSNAGAREAELASSNQERIATYERAYKETFLPEIRNRISDSVFFDALSKEECGQILDIILNKFQERYLQLKDIHLEFSDALKSWLLEESFDAEMGARPLRTIVEEGKLNEAISTEIADGRIRTANHVGVDFSDGEITFHLFS
jgi:ATP-dependent Clp protease ATP-binding subunit ClpA